MNGRQELHGIALLCDSFGRITSVLRDTVGLDADEVVGSAFSSVVDIDSMSKSLSFLVELREKKAAFDWQMNLSLRGETFMLYFLGGTVDDAMLIVGSESKTEAGHLYEEIMKMNNEQTNLLRDALKEQSAARPAPGAGPEDSAYGEMFRLNNELVGLQRDLVKKNVELGKAIEARNQLLGMAAHDLRNPLSSFHSMCGLLLEGLVGELSEQQTEILQVMRDSADFMLTLVNDLLDISTIQAGKLKLNTQRVNLIDLIEANLRITRVLAERKHITLSFHPRMRTLWVDVDPNKIDQVLHNLVSNAVKYSMPEREVQLRVRRGREHVDILVIDQGLGIPASEIGKIFIAFGSRGSRGTVGEASTGLGLAITKRIVDGHGGSIWVESTEGEGSTFTVRLPLSPEEHRS
jgi:two-component system, OmpR family, sensor kinase